MVKKLNPLNLYQIQNAITREYPINPFPRLKTKNLPFSGYLKKKKIRTLTFANKVNPHLENYKFYVIFIQTHSKLI